MRAMKKSARRIFCREEGGNLTCLSAFLLDDVADVNGQETLATNPRQVQ